MYKPYMEDNEIKLIEYYLNTNDTMFEWGSGGSTLWFSKFVKKYYSIEHDLLWYKKVKNDIFYSDRFNINYYFVKNNLPRTYPTKPKEFTDYIKCVETVLKDKKVDKVLIDGRVRVSCAKAILPYLNINSLVFIHDWVRKRYHKVLDWYDIINEISPKKLDATGLGVLRKK